ncbi:MAG: hypothetical protein WC360_09140 [Opitutales bacterium]|jgi:hypothetical protein
MRRFFRVAAPLLLLCLAQNAAATVYNILSDGGIFTQFGSSASATTSYYDLVNSFAGSNGYPALTADFSGDKSLTLNFSGPEGVTFNVEPHAGHDTFFLVEFWIGDEHTGTSLDGLVSSISFDNASGEVPTIFDDPTTNLWYSDDTFYVSCKATLTESFSFTGFSVTFTVPGGYNAALDAASLSGFIGVYEEGYASDPGDIRLLTAVPEPDSTSALIGSAALAGLLLFRKRKAATRA